MPLSYDRMRSSATRCCTMPHRDGRSWCERCKPKGAQRLSRHTERTQRIAYGSYRRAAGAATACAAPAVQHTPQQFLSYVTSSFIDQQGPGVRRRCLEGPCRCRLGNN
jgi:hypothetical protein